MLHRYSPEKESDKAVIGAQKIVQHFGEELITTIWLRLSHMNNQSATQPTLEDTLLEKLKDDEEPIAETIKRPDAIVYLKKFILPNLVRRHRNRVRKEEEKQLSLALAEKMKEIQDLIQKEWPDYVLRLDQALSKHATALQQNLRAAVETDEYGKIVNDNQMAEVDRFLASVGLAENSRRFGKERTYEYIRAWHEEKKGNLESSDVVPHDGHDFEHWVAAQLSRTDWTTSVTQASCDNGVDIIAVREGVSVAIQCKRFGGSVGNSAVQEVYSGMKHFGLDRAVVITTGTYTRAARSLAKTTGVMLLSHEDIPNMWNMLHE